MPVWKSKKLSEGDSDEKILEYARMFNIAWEEFGNSDLSDSDEGGDDDDNQPRGLVAAPEVPEGPEPEAPERRVTRAQTGNLPPPRRQLADLERNGGGGGSSGGVEEDGRVAVDVDGAGGGEEPEPGAGGAVIDKDEPESADTTPEASTSSTSDSGEGGPNDGEDDVNVDVVASPESLGQDADDGAAHSDESGVVVVGDEELGRGDAQRPQNGGISWGGMYEVAEVVDARPVNHQEVGPVQYRVKWKGLDRSFNSWENENKVDEEAKLKFWKNKKAQAEKRNQVTPDIPEPIDPELVSPFAVLDFFLN